MQQPLLFCKSGLRSCFHGIQKIPDLFDLDLSHGPAGLIDAAQLGGVPLHGTDLQRNGRADDIILAGLLQIRGEYGDDIARELAALSLRPCCLYPGEMGHAAQILQVGGGVEQIEGYLAASKLEDGPPFYPHMEDIAELYMPKRQMNDLNMGGM